jgi:hypothetical protein
VYAMRSMIFSCVHPFSLQLGISARRMSRSMDMCGADRIFACLSRVSVSRAAFCSSLNCLALMEGH